MESKHPVTCRPVGLVEIATAFGVSRKAVDQWRARKMLPPARWIVGGRPAWNWSDLEKWSVRTGREVKVSPVASRPGAMCPPAGDQP